MSAELEKTIKKMLETDPKFRKEFEKLDPDFKEKIEPLDPLIAIGIALTQAREAAQLTQAQVAQICGVQQSNIARLERGKCNFTFKTLQRYAEAIGIKELKIKFN